jgi:hypothetical protein
MRNVSLLYVQHANNNEASCNNTTWTANRRSESVGHYQFIKCYHISSFMSYGGRLPHRLSPLMYLCNFLLITITLRTLELTDSPCHLFLWVHPHCITSTYTSFPAHVYICCHLYIYYTKYSIEAVTTNCRVLMHRMNLTNCSGLTWVVYIGKNDFLNNLRLVGHACHNFWNEHACMYLAPKILLLHWIRYVDCDISNYQWQRVKKHLIIYYICSKM